MTDDTLEKRLREKVPAADPRPGFETRIQAMAREPHVRKKRSLTRRLALPALALIVLGLILRPQNQPNQKPIAKSPDSGPTPVVKIEEPVRREYEGIKKDAQWTMSLFRSTLPSIPVSKKEEQE